MHYAAHLHDGHGKLIRTRQVPLTALNDMPDHVDHLGIRYKFWKMHRRNGEWEAWYRSAL